MNSCSRTGPRVSAGKKVKALIMIITPTTVAMKSGLAMGRDAELVAICPLRAIEPPMARAIRRTVCLPVSMGIIVIRLIIGVSTFSPAMNEPLLILVEVKAYSISVRPCGPELPRVAKPAGTLIAIAAETSEVKVTARNDTDARIISRRSSFLPPISGVRPVISAAMNMLTMK